MLKTRGEWKSMVDESCTRSIDRVRKTKPSGWLMAEENDYQFAEKGNDLVSVIPRTVGGPFLTPSVPSSLQVLLSPMTGDPKLYPILVAVHSRLGSIPLVHIDDISNARIFLMENNASKGRCICAAGSWTIPQLTSFHSLERVDREFDESEHPVISSKMLTDLEFKFRFSIRDVKESASCCSEIGFMNHAL